MNQSPHFLGTVLAFLQAASIVVGSLHGHVQPKTKKDIVEVVLLSKSVMIIV
jgi:hypothetical protein